MFAEQLITFSENLNNLRDFVAMVSSFLDKKNKEEIKKNANHLLPLFFAIHKLNPDDLNIDEEAMLKIEEKLGSEIKIELIEEEDGSEKKGVKFRVEGEDQKKFSEAMNLFKADHHRKAALYCNSLISLVSSVEWFLAQLIHKHYKENPGIVGSKEKQFNLDELSAFDSMEDARNFLIEKTVESVLRGSVQEWLEFLKSKLKLSMGYIDEHKAHLIEATQRRNLLVHNGGVVNRIYLANYPKDYGEPPKIGENIQVSYDYLYKTISIFERCFLLIAAELWKKVDANNKDRGKLLINLAFEHLVSERYDIAESLSLFTTKDKTLQESDQLYAKINFWISKKYGNSFEDIRQDIEKEDFSAKSKLFILAKNILLSDFDEAIKDIEYLLNHNEDFSFKEVKNWPLFKEFREQPLYNELLNKYSENDSDASEEKK